MELTYDIIVDKIQTTFSFFQSNTKRGKWRRWAMATTNSPKKDLVKVPYDELYELAKWARIAIILSETTRVTTNFSIGSTLSTRYEDIAGGKELLDIINRWCSFFDFKPLVDENKSK